MGTDEMCEIEMPYDERNDESGRFRQAFTDDKFLSAVQVRDLPTTSDVADTVGCKYRTAYERLKRLEDNGELSSRTVGNSLVWRVSDDRGDGDE